MAEPTEHVPRPGRAEGGIGISTADLPPEAYVSVRAQQEAAVEAAKVGVERQKVHMQSAQDALAAAEAALAALPEE